MHRPDVGTLTRFRDHLPGRIGLDPVWSINSTDRLPTARKGRLPLPSQFLPQSGSSDCVLEAVGPLVITIVMKAVEALTLISGRVSQEILLRNEYLAAENEILRSRLGKRIALSRSERIRLAKLGKKLGKRALHGVSTIVKPETILGWYRSLVAQKFDGSKNRKKQGRPRVDVAVERLVLEMAEANASWGYDRIVGALRNLGYNISDQIVGNILRRNGIPPVPRRKPCCFHGRSGVRMTSWRQPRLEDGIPGRHGGAMTQSWTRFFRDLTTKRIRRGAFGSVPELEAAIHQYVDIHNDDPKPFVWTKTADEIIEKVQRARQALLSTPTA